MAMTAQQTKPARGGEPAAADWMPPRDEIIDRLQAIVSLDQNVTQFTLAQDIGISEATLSRMLAPRVNGERDRFSDKPYRKSWQYLQVHEWRKRQPAGGAIVETSVTKRVARLARYCMVERVIGMLVGETSCGKTEALRHYCGGNPSAIYVHAGGACNSLSTMIEAIWLASRAFRDAGHGRSRKTVRLKWADLVNGFGTSLSTTGAPNRGVTARIVIIDDAHTLRFPVLDMLRELHDDTDVPMILSGTTRLDARVTASGDAHQMYEQLRARVQVRRVILRPTEADVLAVAAAWAPDGVQFTTRGKAFLIDLSKQLGQLRRVKAAVRMVLHFGGRHKVDLAAGEAIDEHHLKLAVDQLEDLIAQ